MQKFAVNLMLGAHKDLPLYCYPHDSNPSSANAAALLRQEDAATSAAGAFDADSSGSDATAE
jgi:hypothetical protein